jgi:DNA-binding transcriptional MerR regulator
MAITRQAEPNTDQPASHSIAEAAEILDITAHTLRYYERIGLLPEIERDAGGRRRYADSDIRVLRFLRALRATGMPIREIQEYVGLYRQGEHTAPDRYQLLLDHQQRVETELEELTRNLEAIRFKVAVYEETGAPIESHRATQ